MAMLECYEPSLIAWHVLSRTADAFMTLDETSAISAMKVLAHPCDDDPLVIAGESGGAGLAGLITAAADDDMRRQIGLDRHARVLVINTENATDPALYRALTNSEPQRNCPYAASMK